MPAQSPTLSPTLSAITAGFLGSSSGMPASTFPTKSAPTSAALVYIPPPRREKTEIREPPNPTPISALMSLKISQKTDTTNNPNPTTRNPVTDPPTKAILKALLRPFLADSATLMFDFTAVSIPKYPANPEAAAPIKNPRAVFHPKKIARIITSIKAIKLTTLDCLFKYAFEPSKIACDTASALLS